MKESARTILRNAMWHIGPYRRPDYNGSNYRPEHQACLILMAALERVTDGRHV